MITLPSRITRRWLRSLNDEELRQAELLLRIAARETTGTHNHHIARQAKWGRTCSEMKRRGISRAEEILCEVEQYPLQENDQ